jgi:hypothetical protein
MVTTPSSRIVGKGSRLHPIVSDLCILLDAIYIAGEAAFKLAHAKPMSGLDFALESSRFPVTVKIPIAGPFYLALTDPRTVAYQIKLVPHFPEPSGTHKTENLRTIHHAVFAAFFVLFYERHRPFLQDRLGRETANWPEFFRFCWAVRNAATHHEFRVNFTNPKVAPVTWAGATYGPADNGRLLIGPNDLSVGDILILIMEMSDELDDLSAPVPQ